MTFNPHITSKQRGRTAAGLRTCIVGEGGVFAYMMRAVGSMLTDAGSTT